MILPQRRAEPQVMAVEVNEPPQQRVSQIAVFVIVATRLLRRARVMHVAQDAYLARARDGSHVGMPKAGVWRDDPPETRSFPAAQPLWLTCALPRSAGLSGKPHPCR